MKPQARRVRGAAELQRRTSGTALPAEQPPPCAPPSRASAVWVDRVRIIQGLRQRQAAQHFNRVRIVPAVRPGAGQFCGEVVQLPTLLAHSHRGSTLESGSLTQGASTSTADGSVRGAPSMAPSMRRRSQLRLAGTRTDGPPPQRPTNSAPRPTSATTIIESAGVITLARLSMWPGGPFPASGVAVSGPVALSGTTSCPPDAITEVWAHLAAGSGGHAQASDLCCWLAPAASGVARQPATRYSGTVSEVIGVPPESALPERSGLSPLLVTPGTGTAPLR